MFVTVATPSQPPRVRHASLQIFLLVFLLTNPLLSFNTRLSGTPLNDGYYALYNLDFAAAHAHFQQWMAAHPEDPLGPASDAAAFIFTEFDRLGVLDIELFADDNRFESRKRPDVDPALKQGFADRISQAERLADTALQHNPKDANALYCKAVTSGMQADWQSLIDRKEYGAFKYSELASKYAKEALAINPTLYDANLAVGIENYMLSLKSAPIRWILGMAGAGTLNLSVLEHRVSPLSRVNEVLAGMDARDGGFTNFVIDPTWIE